VGRILATIVEAVEQLWRDLSKKVNKRLRTVSKGEIWQIKDLDESRIQVSPSNVLFNVAVSY
jgi:hypothetical protein